MLTIPSSCHIDIFSDGLDVPKIKSVLDEPLSKAQYEIKHSIETESSRIPLGSSTVTGHDAYPVFLVREGQPPSSEEALSVTTLIARVVHTSGWVKCRRFRLDQPGTTKVPHGKAYCSIEEAESEMKEKFTPHLEGAHDLGAEGCHCVGLYYMCSDC